MTDEFKRVIEEIGEEIIQVNAANGWDVATTASWQDQNKVPAVLALIHSEVSEGLEAFRHNDVDNFAEEMADAVIRIIDLTYGLGIDLGEAILAKIEVNKTRGYRHGGKRV